MARARLQVGDVGVVVAHGSPPYRRYENVRVVKVGRRWATVEPAHIGRFDADTGGVDNGSFSSDLIFYTPSQLAFKEKVDEARRTIRDAGLEITYSRRWSDEALLDLASWLADRA